MNRTIQGKIFYTIYNRPWVRILVLSGIYTAVLSWCLWLAYELRFDFDVPDRFEPNLVTITLTVLAIKLVCLFFSSQFDGLLSYFSTPDLKRMFIACTGAAFFISLVNLIGGLQFAPPRGVILTDYVLTLLALCATRLGFRFMRLRNYRQTGDKSHKLSRVAIVGAGDSGAALARDLLDKPWHGMIPVAFFDDFRHQISRMHGIPIAGQPEEIAAFKSKYRIDEIIIAMPSAPAKRIHEIVDIIRKVDLPCRTIPSIGQLATGRVAVSTLRPVEIEDLLGREPVEIESEAVKHIIAGRCVMVTGAGGSIGSELCRQILSFGPSKLLLVERSEPGLFVIEQELHGLRNDGTVVPIIADIGNRDRMTSIFRRFAPQVIFHAAAHKHVPMMEAQPGEAIRNNIFGTAQIAELAITYGVERFVLISTDKAVNPTSVMGATKRMAELYIQSLLTRTNTTKFMAVRFGNVLGSSGSVVPTFTRQIRAGGPITVTHPDITRFFMTIPEAVSLVLQSAALGKGGDIFMLDMGKPVRIVDLAVQMIELSGFKPYEDIDIVFTGMRPGEKMHEELSLTHENVTPTKHPKIRRLASEPQHHTFIRAFVDEIAAALVTDESDGEALKAQLNRAIPEYTPESIRLQNGSAQPRIEAASQSELPEQHHLTTRIA